MSAEAKTKVTLGIPQITNCYIDSEYLYYEWTEVSGAKSYDVYYTNTIGKELKKGNTSKNECYILIRDRGIDYSIEVNDKAVSDSATASIYVPEINYADISYVEASCLSLDQLKEWADYQGLEWEVSEEDGYTYLFMNEKDPNNSGINKENAKGYAGSALDGAAENVGKKLDFEYGISKFESFLDKWLSDENKGFGDALSETVDETLNEITETTIEGAFDGIGDRYSKDKDIHYGYSYDSDMVKHAAQCAYMSLLKCNNDEYIEEIKNNYRKASDDGDSYYTYFVSEDATRYIEWLSKSDDVNDRWIEIIRPVK